ncbi:hypothetical protein LRB11_14775 [Ectothiorhodospira haloalkaliphila]|uniref:hypothetical protein n=1 Tax=Ectothiorhodospira haloalkaliphila TaxID=421628 RepID=UPI001EE7D183|nr:hypothetical protein [Ectothiorhodospira haloalkaliphila]MCG5526179.1 hypothetical protein [Ectothiorhodospira haloalkaliphila]
MKNLYADDIDVVQNIVFSSIMILCGAAFIWPGWIVLIATTLAVLHGFLSIIKMNLHHQKEPYELFLRRLERAVIDWFSKLNYCNYEDVEVLMIRAKKEDELIFVQAVLTRELNVFHRVDFFVEKHSIEELEIDCGRSTLLTRDEIKQWTSMLP